MIRLLGALAAVAVVGAAASGAEAAAAKGCFADCMAAHPPTTDDYFAFADDVKGCRDRCDAQAIEGLKASGLYDAYAACTPEPLSKTEFRDLRAANPSWQSQFNVFLWDVRNIFPDRLLTSIEVKTQDMNLIDVSLTADGVVAPGASGTFVIPDFFDGYPAVRYATKVTSVSACRLP
jgi:hypothetical protein